MLVNLSIYVFVFCFLIHLCITGGPDEPEKPLTIRQRAKKIQKEIKKKHVTYESFMDEIERQGVNSDDENDFTYYVPKLGREMAAAFSYNIEPDLNWDAREMIENRGFKFQKHYVVTEDCYILEMHRIINPKMKDQVKPPVLLQHGLIDTSTSWLINSIGGHIDDDDDRNLGFALAKRGYDVWLGNYRGNTYSLRHTTLSPKDPDFWAFTFDNHALQDLPAQIAHMQKITKYDQIAFVGFSQGTLTMFNLLALKPEVAKAINPYIALAPVSQLARIQSPLKFLASNQIAMRLLAKRNMPFLSENDVTLKLTKLACSAFPGLLCENFIYLMCGFSNRQLNATRLSTYFNHMPSSTSMANIVHYGLNVYHKRAEMYDYQSVELNKKCYNNVTVPRIPYENITHPNMFLMSATNDLLADPGDVKMLLEQLKVKFEHRVVEIKEFGHVDFMLSKFTDHYVNQYVIQFLDNNLPKKKLPSDERLILKSYDETTCNPPERNRQCHLNYNDLIKNDN